MASSSTALRAGAARERPRLAARDRPDLAVGIEGAWEIAENSPAVIDRYRTTTIALGYTGDSVVNSMADMASMIAGFFLAWRLPVILSVALVVAAELFVGWLIRDNLTLNVIMLLWPMDWIRAWQSGA